MPSKGYWTPLLERIQEAGLLKTRGRQRTDSAHVFAAVRMLNRWERVGETLRAALNVLAALAPEWLQQQVPPEWFERYGSRVEDNKEMSQNNSSKFAMAVILTLARSFMLRRGMPGILIGGYGDQLPA